METPRVQFPRITKAYAKSLIVKERIVADNDLSVVICIVKLVNGHRVIGTAIVANSDIFDVARGTNIARAKVIEQIIDREMYVLRTNLNERKSRKS